MPICASSYDLLVCMIMQTLALDYIYVRTTYVLWFKAPLVYDDFTPLFQWGIDKLFEPFITLVKNWSVIKHKNLQLTLRVLFGRACLT